MSKKKKKKKRGAQTSFFFPEVIEPQARKDLAQGKFRRAIDGFKNLRKKQPDKFSSELMQAYHGLAGQMIEKGMFKEAEELMAYIEKIGGKSEGIGLLGVNIALKKKDYEKAGESLSNLLSKGKALPNMDKSLSVADVMVLSFKDFPLIRNTHPEIYNGAASVRRGLEKISEEKFEEAWEEVRGLSIQSPFSSWKLFIKGIIAFYQKEDEKAGAAFQRLPLDGPFGEMAEAVLFLVDAPSPAKKKLAENILQISCNLIGREDLSGILPRADYLWRVGRHSDSYQHVFSSLDSFPSHGPGLEGALTRFYFNSIFDIDWKYGDRLLRGLAKIKAGAEKKVHELFLHKSKALFFENDPDEWACCANEWEKFLELQKKIYGADTRLEALVYSHIGSFLTEEVIEDSFVSFLDFSSPKKTLRNTKLAEKYLKKSVELFPDDKTAYLNLLTVYEKTENKSKANKLLDQLILQFPGDKNILVRTGVGCITRKAYVKGIKNLEKARKLDPLDSALKDTLALAYLQTARHYFRKGLKDKGRPVYEKALENGLEKSEDFNRGHAYIYARWAALEYGTANNKEAEKMAAVARAKAVNPLSLIYFSLLILRYYEAPALFIAEMEKEVKDEFKKTPEPQKAVTLIKVFNYMKTTCMGLGSEKTRLIKFAKKAAKKPSTREEAMVICDFSFQEEIGSYNIAEKYIKKMLKKDSEDPRFLFLRFKLDQLKRKRPPLGSDLFKLKKILGLAEERNEKNLAVEVRKLTNEMENAVKNSGYFGSESPFFDSFDDDDDEDEDDYDDEDYEGESCNCPNCRSKREGMDDPISFINFLEGLLPKKKGKKNRRNPLF